MSHHDISVQPSAHWSLTPGQISFVAPSPERVIRRFARMTVAQRATQNYSNPTRLQVRNLKLKYVRDSEVIMANMESEITISLQYRRSSVRPINALYTTRDHRSMASLIPHMIALTPTDMEARGLFIHINSSINRAGPQGLINRKMSGSPSQMPDLASRSATVVLAQANVDNVRGEIAVVNH
ncbi:hypothetical protein RF11_13286 [Thelohanellus kitauei]|uniref:Uncharacterized protein n=1 Tax=Thelohanellus kitauei TaxID=669202 RepID=A0A0C2IFX8_THEKT|nr:hypothetical protein RF11_13286 [Thelohanellus kitauei]